VYKWAIMHRWSQQFIPTLREAPGDAEIASHKLLLRSGYVRQLAAGLYSFLFLGHRSMLKIAAIVRDEMSRVGQELCLPVLHPREFWEASGRWQAMGSELFRLQDRNQRDLCLATSDEEVVTELAHRELRSYKQLPQIWYQIHAKFRDEARPRSGLLRLRQFQMVDSYSFDRDLAGLDISYRKHEQAYRRVFDRCGLKYASADAAGGIEGPVQSRQFLVYSDAGHQRIATCACGFAANINVATAGAQPIDDLAASSGAPVEVATPAQKTIEEVAEFLGVKPAQVIKSYFVVATCPAEDGATQTPVVAFLRGDHSVNEQKLLAALAKAGLKPATLRPMQADEIRECFDLEPGYIGPVGLSAEKFPVRGQRAWQRPQFLFDPALRGRRNLVAGANRPGYHLKNVTPDDANSFVVDPDAWADIREVIAGDSCCQCGGVLEIANAIELGHMFRLGTAYSDTMGLRVLDEHGKELTPVMGSYGLGLEHILVACIEQNNDENGFWLPPSIAPFYVVITPTNTADEKINAAASQIAQDLEAAGIDVLLDDRDERPGVKFKDADLVGIPYRVNIGKKLGEGMVELFTRSTNSKADVPTGDVIRLLRELLQAKPAVMASGEQQ
jgi:prolyl-tRNA synthetase